MTTSAENGGREDRDGNTMALIAEMSRSFAVSEDIDRTLATGLARIAREMGAAAASVFVLVDDGSGDLVCRASFGPVSVAGKRVPGGKGIVGRCVARCAGQIVRDVAADPDFLADIDAQTGFSTRSILCAPMSVRGECLGAIELLNKDGEAGLFDTADLAVLEVLAAAAGLALANAQLSRQLTALGDLGPRAAPPTLPEGEGPPWHLTHLRVAARPDGLKGVRAGLTRAVRATCPSCDEMWLQDLVLAVDEACQNIVRHAYAGRDDGEFNLDLFHHGDKIEARLTDFARTVDPSTIKPRDLDELRPGGLGTHFIHEVMDEVTFEAPEGGVGNVLRLTKRLQQGEGA